MLNIAIIGAGFSGLNIANQLKDIANVTLFEKARGVSGRMTTRYADNYQFDHGTQCITARTDEFKAFINGKVDQGILTEWTPNMITLEEGAKPYKRLWFEPHYIATPKMNDLCKHMAQGLNINVATRIKPLSPSDRTQNGWTLHDEKEQSYGPFDWVISSAPAPQTYHLFESTCQKVDTLSKVKMVACHSLLVGIDEEPHVSWDAAKVKNSPIEWIALNHRKPGRSSSPSILVQTTHQWSEANKDSPIEEVEPYLIDKLESLLQQDLSNRNYTNTHRWLYASCELPLNTHSPYLLDKDNQLAVCGDWCFGNVIESAFVSSSALFKKLKKTF